MDYAEASVSIMTNYGKLLEKCKYQTILPVSWETCIQVKKQWLEPCMEQLIGSRSRKEYDRAVCCHTCLFNLYAEHIMKNARLDELQAGIKTDRKNINNFRYADDTTLTAESEKELKSFWLRVKKESERAGLRLILKKLRSWHPAPLLHGK